MPDFTGANEGMYDIRPLGIALLLPAYLIACGANGRGAPIVHATVGQARISSDDVSYRLAVEKAYGNDSVTEVVALVAIIADVLEREVARTFRLDAAPDEIAALSRHVDQTTRAPEILAGVKDAFGDDRAAYDRLYLAPRIVNRKLRGWYSRSAKIHKHERDLIERAHTLVRSGKSLEEAALASGLQCSTIELGKRVGTMPSLLEQYLPHNGESSDGPLSATVAKMAEGEIYKGIIEDDHGYMVIRLVRSGEERYTVEAISAGKQPFDAWFREQAAKIEIEILDHELGNSILSDYPEVWWVKKWLAHTGTVGE